MTSAPKPPPGYFNVLYFASASSRTGKDHEAFPANLTLKGLFAELESRYPGIQAMILDSCLVTINLDYVDAPGEQGGDDVVIHEADEVAIIPPTPYGGDCYGRSTDEEVGLFPGSSGSSSPSCRFSILHHRRLIDGHFSGFSFTYRRSLRTPTTTRSASKAKSKAETVEMMPVRLVMVDTWHPKGWLRSSQRSAQWGQTCSSYAGASSGILCADSQMDTNYTCQNLDSLHKFDEVEWTSMDLGVVVTDEVGADDADAPVRGVVIPHRLQLRRLLPAILKTEEITYCKELRYELIKVGHIGLN
ncbi:hypothetical protein G7046_g7755 [Stylonectria norvegica]|nr:hypothetical protein G7046_g7755 [Stylonectria norvegica]